MSAQQLYPQAKLFRALSNTKRLEILQLLRMKSLSVSDIVRMTHVSQANVSQHLIVLKNARVVVPQRTGKEIKYSISHQNFIKAFDVLNDVLVDRKQSQPVKKLHTAIPHVEDPVCGMSISPQTAIFWQTFRRSTYYFCASGCHKQFIRKPERYVNQR